MLCVYAGDPVFISPKDAKHAKVRKAVVMINSIQPILDKALGGERLTAEDCTALLESNDFVRIGLAADEIRMHFLPPKN